MTESTTVALVTGASRGIGRASALALAAAGHPIAVGYRSDREGADEAVAKMTADGADAMAVPLDVRDVGSVERAFKAVESAIGPVRILVNNAGFTRDGLAVKYSAENWAATLETNLTGSFRCVQRALPSMLKARWGRIINVASVAALRGNSGQTAYSASKAGVVGMTRSLARELGGRGITANAVCPGFVETKMTESTGREQRQRYVEMTPAGRFGTPEEVAAVIAFLARPEASYVNGAIIAVDGGLSA
jgi:3-oxoacyl-[acyl-carrier protein] reductase